MSVTTPIKEDLIQEQILQAAKRLFAVHGLAKVTMDDVAKAIGKGRSSLYYYYKSKDEIFDAVMKIEIKEMLETLEKAVDEKPTTEEKIHAFVAAKFRLTREKSSFFNAIKIGMDADALTDFNKTKIAHHHLIMKMESALFSRILNTGIKQGELKAINETDMDTLIYILLSSIRGLRNEMSLPDNMHEPEPAIARFVSVIMHGLK
ncbi:TetR family transcriptional regulator [Mucilaginibacter frigoritolerans]|uniref:TetR family transcriptional regulator n=1 Tax=Mucilaginibacter frigoritolerans TaxID=652788 RepID=A0A562UC06_9SPHI|nr:TetR/AcrR family transcriptional regulator [Mucilaginibacter frigoritolerans]TWJ03343.1 TetR family transcriptional regulator [Mucilaginibacter frigoritolerans]